MRKLLGGIAIRPAWIDHGALSTKATRATAITLILAGTLGLGACSAITDPYVSIGSPKPGLSFTEAIKVAREKKSELEQKQGELEQWDVVTSSMIFGSGLAGLGFAVFGAHTDAILGAGMAAGAGYGARSFVPVPTRKAIYQNGADAIECAIAAISLGLPETTGSGDAEAPASDRRTPLLSALGTLRTAVAKDLSLVPPPTAGFAGRSIESLRPSAMASTAAVQFRLQLLSESARETNAAAERLISVTNAAIDMRGPRLITATAAILSRVSTELLAARVDPDAALDALRKHSSASATFVRQAAQEVKDAASDTAAKKNAADAAMTDLQTAAPAEGLRANVEPFAEAAEATGSKVNEIKDSAQKILDLVKLGTSCLGTTKENVGGGSEG